MFNAVFVLVVMLLQANKDVLHLDWPFNIKTNITFFYDPTEVTILIHKQQS
jgi:chitin synthase